MKKKNLFYALYCMITATAHIMTPQVACSQSTDTTFEGFSPFPAGAAINVSKLKNNATYRALVIREYNSLTPENAMKMSAIHPQATTWSWADADTLVNFGIQYNKRVHGHTLVWHNSVPNWVTNFSGDSAAWENLLKTHIQTVVTRYKGKVASWDVVNEAVLDDGTLRNTIWLQHLGRGYIARSFQYAHEADSAALLFYNDYGHEYSTAKLNTIDSLVRALKNAGVPIQGVGLQMHVHRYSDNRKIETAITTMTQTGLLVHIAELDVRMNPDEIAGTTFTNTLSHLQFAKYKLFARLTKNIPAAQRFGLTTWGVSDADSYASGNPDWPLPFDGSYQKKLAFGGWKDGATTAWNFDSASCTSLAGTYTDLGSNGTAITTNISGGVMTYDNDHSAVQNIGFNFLFNGTTYTQFVLNSNGYIKLGAAASTASFYYSTATGLTGGTVAASDIDLLYPYNHDLTGTGSSEYRVYVTGATGSRVCTIQFKNVKDKLPPVQYATMNFQVKLYETTNVIEFVYGNWTASASAAALITGAAGIKGVSPSETVNIAKGSAVTWNTAMSAAANYYFKNGDYPAAGPAFNTKNNVLPDAGRIFRFAPATINLAGIADAYVRDGSYAAINYGADTFMTVKKDVTAGYNRIAYLKFKVPAQSRSAVGNAQLQLYVSSTNSGTNTTQWQLWKANNNNWTETGINYSNRPAQDSLLVTINGTNNTGYQYWDITTALQNLTGDTLSLVLVSTNTGATTNANFASREVSQEAYRPQLIITTGTAVMARAPLPLLSQPLTADGTPSQDASPRWYPNPANHYLLLAGKQTAGQLLTATIFSTTGQLLLQKNGLRPGEGLDVHTLAAGTYYIQLTTNHKTIQTRKIIISH